jgi:DNA-binding response OmpR family regulator
VTAALDLKDSPGPATMLIVDTAKVLVVEDTPEIRDIIELSLAEAHFDVRTAGDGQVAMARLREWRPEVVVLDLNIPGLSGLEVCRQLRQFSNAYVLMLTGRADEVDKLVGLAAGADDYLTKPFSPRELVARIQAMLRRPRVLGEPEPAGAADERVVGPVHIDVAGREARVGDHPVTLTKLEFDLLTAITDNVRQVRTREQLRERVWGGDWLADDHAVDVHMSKLRRKLADAGAGALIETVRGVGYRIRRTRP